MGTSTSFSKRYPSEEKMSDISYAPSITNLSNTKVKVTPADVGILTSLQQLRLREEIILLQSKSTSLKTAITRTSQKFMFPLVQVKKIILYNVN
jgi:hypothetical protein